MINPLSKQTKTGWWFGTWLDYMTFPSYWEWNNIPADEVIFFRGVGIPPTSKTQQLKHAKHNLRHCRGPEIGHD